MQRTATLRKGAVIPLFAILTPVIILVCGLAVNIAYMHLVRTELRVATDAAARAGGRAFSENQNVDDAVAFAASTAAMNHVAGRPLLLNTDEVANEIEFGLAQRTNNGLGRYAFTEKSRSAVRDKLTAANSIRINGKKSQASASGSVPLLFSGYGPFNDFEPIASSIATQVDRDISLVVDISGSMAWEVDDYTKYYTVVDGVWVWSNSAKKKEYEEWRSDYDKYRSKSPPTDPVPRHSRWVALRTASEGFFNVLNASHPREFVSLVTFSSGAQLNFSPTSIYKPMKDYIQSLKPNGKTYIAAGMETAVPALMSHPAARPYAQKTIVIFTDGVNTTGSSLPATLAQQIVDQYPITIHTITFSANADQTTMRNVAEIGGGKHFHADTAAQLTAAFKEIANNMPTVLTN
jgi:Flp pilus assembly protein TadG